MDVTVVDELNTIEATTVDLTVEVPNTSPSVDVTQQRLNTDVTLNNNQIVVEGGLTIENVNETFDVETNSVVITLDVVDPGSTVVVKESVLDVAVEAKTEIVEVLYGPGGGGITIADMNAIYAYAGADSANTVTNNRFFTNLFGWTISGGGTRLERTDPEVPANAPSQFVCKFGGQLARYTGKVLNVVSGERVYAEVSVATLAGGAPTISLKVFRYGPTGVKLGEETLDFANSTSAWTRLAGFFETPNDGTTTVEFVLEISGANNTYDNTKRWYFTNGKLYSTASEEILSASIETINTILYDPIDGLTVQYSLALNNNGRITGIRANATGAETDFAILTDKFYVLDPTDDNNYEQVFEIVNGVVKLRELIANDITTTTITVKNNGQIKVQDSQMVPVDRVEIGKIGADYGLRVRNAAGDIIFNVDSLGANTVNSTQLVSGAVTPGKTNIAAINSGSGNLNSDVVDVANIINGAVTAAKTNLAAINSGTGNLNSNTVDTAQIIASAVTAAKTNLAAINSSTGNLNSNTVDTAQIINGAISDAAKFSNSIRPVEVVATLPVTGNFDGRTVFLTTDKKIYRYDAVGAAYTASVPAGDLSGQIVGTQITDGSITTPKIAANAVTANEIAANTITAAKIAANTITAGQIAAATITATQIAANSITASRLLITNSYNMVADADLQDTNYWVYQTNGITINSSDSIVTTNLGIRAAWKSANGNGTLSQAANEAGSSLMIVEAGKPYRFYIKTAVTSGFTGVNVLYILWYKRDGSASSITPLSSFAGADYRAVASGGIVTFTIDGQVTAPSDAHYMRIQPTTLWSTVINNAGNGYLGLPQVNRANNGELIVDGTITAAKIQAGTITGDRIAANTITASRLLITNSYNMIADADLRDTSYWSIGSGWTINTVDSVVTSNLQTRAAWKSPTGNGTTSQSVSGVATANMQVEPGKPFRISGTILVTTGFTGLLYLFVSWFKQDGSASSTPVSTLLTTSYKSVAAGSNIIQTLDSIFTAPSDAYYARWQPVVEWSTTLNNAGNVYAAFPQFNRAANGELIVDGSITALKIQANTITATQIAAGTITATQIAANTITASKLVITSGNNLIADADLYDTSYWTFNVGWSINTADAAITTLGVRAAIKSVAGNGTTSQTATYATMVSNSNQIEANKPYRISSKVYVPAGFTGRAILYAFWYDRTNTYLGSSSTVGADYRTSAAGANTVATLDGIVTSHASAAYFRLSASIDWSTTINNAGNAYFSTLQFNRANNGELIVDGTITAAKIQANTITASQIAAGTITATQIASGTITATQLAAGSVTASKLLVSNFENLIPNGDLRSGTLDGFSRVTNGGGTGAITVPSSTGWPSLYGLKLTRTSNSSSELSIVCDTTSFDDTTMTGGIASNINSEYYFEAVVWAHSGVTMLAEAVLRTNNTTITSLPATAGTNSTSGGTTLNFSPGPSFVRVSGTFTNNVGTGKLYIRLWSLANTAVQDAYFWNIYLKRKSSGELIVDGAITAAKIAANTITAGQIAAGTITSNEIATDSIKSSTWNNTTKTGWLLGTNGDIQASDISIWSPGVTPKKIFGASGMSYNGSNFYGLDQIITKINKASEDGSPDTQIFDGTNPDTWVDLCDLAITATGGQDIDIDVSTDMLIEQLFDPTVLIKYAVGSPEFRFRLRRTQGSTVDIKTSEWYKITSAGQVPAALFTVRDTTAVAGAATYLLQAQWRKGYYNTGTVSKSAATDIITGNGVSWIANTGASGSTSEAGFPGVRANGSINFTGQPANGNTFTLNGTTVTFVTGTPTGNQVQIGINLNTTINNAVSFLNGSADAEISKCTYFNGGGTQIIIFYDVIGTAGNSFTLAEVGANTTVSGATLAGGQAAPSNPWEIKVASVDPNWWPINTITSRTGLTFNPDTSGYNALSLASLTNAAYEIRANFHAVIMRLKNYTIRTTEYRNTAVT